MDDDSGQPNADDQPPRQAPQNDAWMRADLTDTSWMSSGLTEMIRQRAHHIYAQFYEADEWTSDEMERTMYDTEDRIIDRFGEYRANELLEPEIEFASKLFDPWSLLPAVATAATSLLVFRKGPSAVRSMIGKRSAPPSYYSNATGTQGTANASGYQFSQRTGKPNRALGTLRFVTEFAAASFLGLVAFDYAIGPVEENEEAPKLPLVEGLSITSMYKCPSYMSIYGGERQADFWDVYKKTLDDSGEEDDRELRRNLEYYEKWALNCAKRDAFERDLRKRNAGLAPAANNSNAEFVPIPPPGVPEDYPIDHENIGTLFEDRRGQR